MVPEENPYAPPSTASPEIRRAPKSYGWRIEDGRLMVKISAMLPMVDPITGRSSEIMTQHRVVVPCQPKWLSSFGWIGALAGLLFFRGGNEAFDLLFPALFGFVCGWFISYLAGMFQPKITLHLYHEKATLRIQRGISVAEPLLFISAIFCLNVDEPGMMLVFYILIALWVVALLASRRFRTRLRSHGGSNGWFPIRGFHSGAIRLLTEMQTGGPQTAR